MKPLRQAMNRYLRPNRAAIQPTGAVMIAAAVMYEVSTQVISSKLADRLPCIYGSATLAMVWSSACISVAPTVQRVMIRRCGT